MYFVRTQPLKDKLRSRSLSDREALPYLLVFSGLTALVGSVPLIEGFNRWDFASATLSVVFAIAGVVYSYKCNGGREGFDLIQKYVVLGWVVSIRCLLPFIPLAIVAYIAADALGAATGGDGSI